MGLALVCGTVLYAAEFPRGRDRATAIDRQSLAGGMAAPGSQTAPGSLVGEVASREGRFACDSRRASGSLAAALPARPYACVLPTGVTITVPDDYPTIQTAIDAAAPGDTVFVRAGTYFEHIVLDKQLTLQGEDAATTAIDGGGLQVGLEITADGFVLQGFTFQHCGSGTGYDYGVRVLDSQYARIANCRFTENASLYLYVFRDSTVEQCEFDNNYYGIINDCDISGMGGLYGCSILSNVFEQNVFGIFFSHNPGAFHNLIQGNLITNNYLGIYIIYSFNNEFSYNVFSDNTNYAFYLDICMCGAYFNRIHHNAFLNNNPGGIQAYEEQHSGPDYFNYWYSPDDGVGNFWSDYTGVDYNHNGLGDSPYLIPTGYSNDPHPLMHRFVLGDMNIDGVVDGYDIDAFVLGLTDPAAYQDQYLQPAWLLGDCNFDEALNGYDIDAFVYRLTHPDELPVVPNRPPLPPFNPNPVDTAGGVTSPCLNWSCADPDTVDTELEYDVYLEPDNPAPSTLVAGGQADDCWCTGTLLSNTTYYWQIVARDRHGAETAGPVWHFTTAPNVWSIETLSSDLSSSPGVSLAVDSQDTQHVSYCSTGGALNYATWTGTAWDTQLVVAADVSLAACALDSTDAPHFSYYAAGGLQHTWWTGSDWATELVDPSTVTASAIAVDSQNRTHIAYVAYVGTNRSLKYATWDGSAWVIEIVDPSNSTQLAIAVDGNDEPHVLYGDLRYAHRSGGAWTLETVYSGDQSYSGPSVAVDSGNHPHASFVDGSPRTLKYGYRVGSSWYVETVVAAGTVAFRSALRLDALERPHIACCASGAPYGSGLQYITKPGFIWVAEAVDTSGAVRYLSLALDSDGHPLIAYDTWPELNVATKAAAGE